MAEPEVFAFREWTFGGLFALPGAGLPEMWHMMLTARSVRLALRGWHNGKLQAFWGYRRAEERRGPLSLLPLAPAACQKKPPRCLLLRLPACKAAV